MCCRQESTELVSCLQTQQMFPGKDESSRYKGCHTYFYKLQPSAVQEERGPRKTAKLWRPHTDKVVSRRPQVVATPPAMTSSEMLVHTVTRCSAHPALARLPPVIKVHAVRAVVPQMFLLLTSLATGTR